MERAVPGLNRSDGPLEDLGSVTRSKVFDKVFGLQIRILPRIAPKIPRTNPMTASAMIRGIAARIRLSRGVKSSVTDVRIGEMLSFSVAALAYCTTVAEPRPTARAMRPFADTSFSLRLSNAMKDNGRLGFL